MIALLMLQILLGLCLCASCAYYLFCLDSARRWFQECDRYPTLADPPPVTILKPIRGSDPAQDACFRSFCTLDYPRYQLLFGALDPDDPGLETVRRLQAEFPDRDISLVTGGAVFGFNRKVCNLEQMRQAAKYDLLVLCDSDMFVQPKYLQRVAAPFADPTVGLVTCPYRGFRAENLTARLEALGIGADFLPSVLLTRRLFGMDFAFGSTIALRTTVLDALGGFPALANELADDFLLGNRTKAAGSLVVLSDYVVDDSLGRERWRDSWARRLRWAKTARAMRPGGWNGAFITQGTALSLLFLLATGFRAAGWLGMAITFTVRAVTATLLARNYTRDPNLPRLLPLLPLSDLVSFALWVGSFFGRHIVWRGERFRLEAGGRLVQEENSTS